MAVNRLRAGTATGLRNSQPVSHSIRGRLGAPAPGQTDRPSRLTKATTARFVG